MRLKQEIDDLRLCDDWIVYGKNSTVLISCFVTKKEPKALRKKLKKHLDRRTKVNVEELPLYDIRPADFSSKAGIDALNAQLMFRNWHDRYTSFQA